MEFPMVSQETMLNDTYVVVGSLKKLGMVYYFLYFKWIFVCLSKQIQNWIVCIPNKIQKLYKIIFWAHIVH